MSFLRCILRARRAAAVTFGVLFLVLPVALLTSVRLEPLILTVIVLGGVSVVAGLVAPPSVRGRFRNAAKGLVTAAILLAILHFVGLLEPMYRREGWLVLDLDIEVEPLRVHPGDSITYTLTTTNGGLRAVLGRGFSVDGVSHLGLLMYGRLPDLDGVRFSLSEEPIALLDAADESGETLDFAHTIAYANPGIPELNPASWEWSTTYTPGDEVIGLITGDGTAHHDLGVGETLMLRYAVTVPTIHPAGEVHHVRASLSYRDPQWATYYTHDLWFPFEDTVLVERDNASD